MAIDVPNIFASKKTLSVPGSWVERDGQRLMLVAALDIDGVTVEGLVLRGTALKDCPDEAVMFQLEFKHDPKRPDRAIDRVDWRPLHSHNNRGKGPNEHRYKLISGTHRHAFDLNWLKGEERMRKMNLPIAQPVNPDLVTYDNLIEFVRKCFRISPIEFPIPPWEADLL